jgi:hypothetical protein
MWDCIYPEENLGEALLGDVAYLWYDGYGLSRSLDELLEEYGYHY